MNEEYLSFRNARALGKFTYYWKLCGLEDIEIPFKEGTIEYEGFVEGFDHAFYEQSRFCLRISDRPVQLASYFGVEWPRPAK